MDHQLEQLLPFLRDAGPVEIDGKRRFVVFFSWTDGTQRARVFNAVGDNFEIAWQIGAAELKRSDIEARWLRVDWVDAVERRNWGELRSTLSRIKRNYFRLGISLDPEFRHAFLETEINANAMLYGGAKDVSAILNERNFAIYARKRHGLGDISFPDDGHLWLFTTKGAFLGEDGRAHGLSAGGLDAGRRSFVQLQPDDVLQLVSAGSAYLASQVREDGRFIYGWHPCFDRQIGAYNNLRHASTLYSMLEAWEVTRDDGLWAAIERALDCLTGKLIEAVELPGGADAAFLVDEGGEIKLGGNAVAILALAKHAALTGEMRYRELASRLGEGILFMQDPQDGSFKHVLNHPSLTVKQDFRIIYYDGEAAFGLMRLYELTGDQRWLAAVEKAFGHFIRQEHWRAHDHWLSYCVNELTRHRPEERYFQFGLDNFRTYLGFVQERITTFPTLLELMMAAQSMIARLEADPQRRGMLGGIDLPRFYKALHHRAHYLLNGHFWPELAMFYADPAKIAGSFFIRHHAFRVRIDDVEHYLSGLVAYRRYLLEAQAAEAPPAGIRGERKRSWSAADVERATGGRWVSEPPAGWTASGLCIASPTMREGDMVALRPTGGNAGVTAATVRRLAAVPAAWIVSEPSDVTGHDSAPAIMVDDVGQAILDLGSYAREQIGGKLIGVTGSAGKTSTVAMMAHALQVYGPVGRTRHNANLPHGIAWNLASIPWDVPHSVLELAIGRMAQNARLARPDVAVFTNILPAHLEYHRDLPTIADRKSAIFEGMQSGGVAVLNRDMAEWERVHMAARARGLRVLHYGTSREADFRLLDHDPQENRITAQLGARKVDYRIGAAGLHMALNSLAVLAAVEALGLQPDAAIERLASFRPLTGRGAERELVIHGRRITLLDEAYNANPGSMAAAIALLGSKRGGRRIAALGEMAELGRDAQHHHTELAPLMESHGIDRVHAVGGMYDGFWEALPASRRGTRPGSVEALRAALIEDVREGDVILLKGSHSSMFHELADALTSEFRPPMTSRKLTECPLL